MVSDVEGEQGGRERRGVVYVIIRFPIRQMFDVTRELVFTLRSLSKDNSVSCLGERAGIEFTAENCVISEGRGGRGGRGERGERGERGGRGGRGRNIPLEVLTEVAYGKECKMSAESILLMVVGL